MTRREVLAWLDARRPAPPPALRVHLHAAVTDSDEWLPAHLAELGHAMLARVTARPEGGRELALDLLAADAFVDRKSTRLNSSHSQISYAVFCLKKKKKQTSHSLVHSRLAPLGTGS